MTFSFEMRSGREHNTPDKAMWGFSCTVRAQVSLKPDQWPDVKNRPNYYFFNVILSIFVLLQLLF